MMSFLNSLSIRIPLAVIGGILYGLLTYAIILVLNLPLQLAIGAGLFVSFLYLVSRLLILFSGIDTPYYSKERKGSLYENTTFYQTVQWVGKFYHHHDMILFLFMTLVAIAFIITLIMDLFHHKPFGQSAFDLLTLFRLEP